MLLKLEELSTMRPSKVLKLRRIVNHFAIKSVGAKSTAAVKHYQWRTLSICADE
jgi:hypothetical protein